MAITFEFAYANDGAIGFNDPVQGATRRAALEREAATFGAWFNDTATLKLDVFNTNQPAGAEGRPYLHPTPPLLSFSGVYPSIPELKILGDPNTSGNPKTDPNGAATDGSITVNWGGPLPYELGDNVVDSQNVDFAAVVRHELAHVLGFLTSIGADGTDDYGDLPGTAGVWRRFDTLITDSGSAPFINAADQFKLDGARWAQKSIAGGTASSPNSNDGLFFNGANAKAANGGNPVPLHSPNPFVIGSSVSHVRIVGSIDDTNSMMLYTLRDGQVSRRFSDIELGMLKDLGYSMNALATGFSLFEPDGQVDVSESGTSDSFTIRLDSRPTSNVVINVINSATGEFTVAPTVLTFTPMNWATPQTVTVTGVNDNLADGDSNNSLVLRVDDALSNATYHAVPDGSINVKNTDVGVNTTNPFLVTTWIDEDQANASDGTGISLREAVRAANQTSGTQTITFAPFLSGSPIRLLGGEIDITDSVTIVGLGSQATILDGSRASRIFNIDNGASSLIQVSIQHLTMMNGAVSGTDPDLSSGGAIRSRENLELLDSVISGSTASRFGGAIDHRNGLATIQRSTFKENTAYSGGAIINYPGAGMTISDSTIHGNTANIYAGGGVFNQAPLTITRSTISGNTASSENGRGGGILSRVSSVTIDRSTITNNTATLDGGGLLAGSPSDRVTNSIVAGNRRISGVEDNVAGTIETSSFNLVSGNPRLFPLAFNGGPTATHALHPGSPAFDAGDPAINDPNTRDQRGQFTLFDGDSDGTPRIDIGAFEAQIDKNTIVVHKSVDELEDNALSEDFDLSLREAVNLAIALPGRQTIVFDRGLDGIPIPLTMIGDTTFGPTALLLATEITIRGPVEITRDKSIGDARLIRVFSQGDIVLDTVTLSNGEAVGGNGGSGFGGGGGGGAGLGGAILNEGNLTISRSLLVGNEARGGDGGASGVGSSAAIGGSGGGSLSGNGSNATAGLGANGAMGAGNGGNATVGNTSTLTAGDGANATSFGGGGGGGGFARSFNSNPGSVAAGGIGGAGQFGGGSGGFGGASGAAINAVRPPTATGFGGGVGRDQGGGGGGGMGGAIFNHGGTITVSNTTFSGNLAVGGDGGEGGGTGLSGQAGMGLGGAIFSRNGTVSIQSSTMFDNVVQVGSGSSTVAEGTAIYLYQENGTAQLQLDNSILASSDFRSDAFNNGGAVQGGAI